jgi:signal transduction histidine kinase
VRSRVLAGILAMMIVTVSATGVMLYYLLHRDMLTRVDESLKRTTYEFEHILENPVSPRTREPYPDASALLYEVMQNTVAAPHEGFAATVGNTLRWTAPSNVDLRLEDDPQFLSWAVSVPLTDEVFLRSVTTDTSSYRAVILPASVSGDTSDGRYIVAFDTDAEVSDLNAVFIPYIWVSIGALGLATLVSWFVTGRMLYPLRALGETARQVSERDLSQRIDVRTKGDLAELTATFNSMLDRVENAVTANRQLLDDVGHELRTPVTIVRGHLELLDPSDPDEVTETRDISLEELDRMAALIDDLLLLAKAEKASFVKLGPVDVDDVLSRVFVKAQALGERDWSINANTGAWVLADEQRLTQALLQLCENAVKYSDEGSAVALRAQVASPELDEPARVVLSVADHGVGIPADELELVFERFTRGSDTKRVQGSGLGLSICQAIVLAHGGELTAISTPGEGSTFSIALNVETTNRDESAEDL